MKQSVPWSVKGVGPDARETAKELARRSGMTLGQWLNAMIAEQTSEDAQSQGEEGEQHEPVSGESSSPLQNLVFTLDSLNRRASATAAAPPVYRPHHTAEPTPAAEADRVRQSEERTATILQSLLNRSAESEGRTAKLIDSLAKANRDTEAKTASALSAVAKWIEAAERAPRAASEKSRTADRQTVEAIRAIATRLDQIESRLPAEGSKPLKTTIEKLESRLTALLEQTKTMRSAPDDFARTAAELDRRLAEVAAKLDAVQEQKVEGEHAHHAAGLEAKLAEMIEVMASRGAPGARGRPAPAAPRARPSLDHAIAQISSRQTSLEAAEEDELEELVWPPRPRNIPAGAQTAPPPVGAALNGLQDQIARLTEEISTLRQAGRDRNPPPVQDPAIKELRDDVANIARNLAAMPKPAPSEILNGRLDDLAERIDGLRQSGLSETALRSVERHMTEIVRAVSDMRSRDAGPLGDELKAISAKLDEMAHHRSAAATGNGTEPSRDAAVTGLRADIAGLARSVAALGAAGGAPVERRLDMLSERIEALHRQLPEGGGFQAVERQLADLVRGLSQASPSPDIKPITESLMAISSKLDAATTQRGDAKGLAGQKLVDQNTLALEDLRREVAQLGKAVAAGAPAAAFGKLEARIGTLAERIDDLRGEGASEGALASVERHLADIARAMSELSRPDVASLGADLRKFSSKLDLVAAQGIDAGALLRLQKQTEEIGRMVADFAKSDVFDAMTARLDDLAARLDGVDLLADRADATGTASLEPMIRQLVDKLEVAQRPNSDDRAMIALERQITRIAEKLDRSDPVPANLSGIERSLGELFAELQQTRSAALEAADGAAAKAVRDALAMVPEKGSVDAAADDVRRHLVDMRSHQDQAGRKTQLTLEAVHATLERLASRMSQLEDGVEEQRAPLRSDGLSAEIKAAFAPSATSPVPRAPEPTFSAREPTFAAPRPTPAVPAGAPAPTSGQPLPDAGSLPPIASAPPGLERRPAKPLPPIAPAPPGLSQRPAVPRPPREAPAAEPVRSVPVFGQQPTDLDLDMDVPLEPGTGGQAGRPVASLGEAPPAAAPRAPAAPAASDPRASFIAAARRAAQAAAAEAASGSGKSEPRAQRPDAAQVSAQKATSRMGSGGQGEAGALAKVRDVFERRRRPILLGLAAAMVVLGTFQIVKQTFPGEEEAASRIGPATSTGSAATPALPAETETAPADADLAPKPQSNLLSPETMGAAPPATAEVPSRSPVPASAEVPSGVPSLGDAMVTPPVPAAATAEATGSVRSLPRRLLEAAKAGDPRGLYDLASRIADPKNPRRDLPTAAEHYQHAASKGFAPAQYRIASMYEKGLGVTKNLKLAASWYERAAANGNIKAMHNMAVLHAEGGIEGKPNYASAAQWFRKAAEYGLRDSEYNYAILVARGLGSSPDLPEAYRWFAIAAAEGDSDAAGKRDEVGARLDAATRTRVSAEAAAFVPRSAPADANDTSLPAVAWDAAEASGA